MPRTGGRSAWWRAPTRCCEFALIGRLATRISVSKPLSLLCRAGRLGQMHRKLLIAIAVALAGSAVVNLGATTSALAFGSWFTGPGPGITGNSVGGIIPYRPDPADTYQQIAEE